MSYNDVKNLVPVLDGSNWLVWENQMTAYLCSKGLWKIVDGFDSFPPNILGKKRHVQAADGTISEVIDPPESSLKLARPNNLNGVTGMTRRKA